jgi:hypothetical protein
MKEEEEERVSLRETAKQNGVKVVNSHLPIAFSQLSPLSAPDSSPPKNLPT